MSIETDLYAALAADPTVAGLVSTRIYPSLAPENAALPFITYALVSGVRSRTIAGVGDGVSKRIQIDANAATYSGAKALAAAVISALEGNGYLELEYDLYDPETQTHTAIVDWSFMTI